MTFYREGFLIDVVVGDLEYCHRISVSTSFERSFPTLDPTLLLLSKAQRVEPRRADLQDMAALLCSDVATAIDWDYLGSLLGKSWPLWFTVGRSQQHLRAFVESEVSTSSCDGLNSLARCLAECPRSLAWRVRSLFGTLLPWNSPVDPVSIEQTKREGAE